MCPGERASLARLQSRKYEHVQIYADPNSIYPHQWDHLVVNYSPGKHRWTRDKPLAADKATPFCTDTSAGSINWHFRFDYPYFEKHPEAEENLPLSLLCLAQYRSKQQRPDSVVDAKKPPPVKKRAAIFEEHIASWTALPEAEQGGSQKKRKRSKPQARGGARDRTKANYSKPHWRKECWRIVKRLDLQGLRGILEDTWKDSLDHMQSP